MPTPLIDGRPTSLVPQHQVAQPAELIPDARLVTVDRRRGLRWPWPAQPLLLGPVVRGHHRPWSAATATSRAHR